MEDFISRVDAPLLTAAIIGLFPQLILDFSQLHQFIGRTEAVSSALNTADLTLGGSFARVELYQNTRAHPRPMITLSTPNWSDWQLSPLVQALSSFSPTLSTLKTINIHRNEFVQLTTGWDGETENSQWLLVFRPFTSEEFAPIQGHFTTCRACTATTRGGKTNRGVTRASKYFCRRAPAIGSHSERSQPICRRVTTLQSPRNGRNCQILGVNARKVNGQWVLFASHPLSLVVICLHLFTLRHMFLFVSLTDDPALIPTLSQTQYAL